MTYLQEKGEEWGSKWKDCADCEKVGILMAWCPECIYQHKSIIVAHETRHKRDGVLKEKEKNREQLNNSKTKGKKRKEFVNNQITTKQTAFVKAQNSRAGRKTKEKEVDSKKRAKLDKPDRVYVSIFVQNIFI